jgi:hypothetical protein
VKGTLTFTTTEAGTGGIGTQDDVCIDASVLAEYYCEGSDVEVVNYTCPNGCEDGACKGEQPASITVLSPNGGEVWEKGVLAEKIENRPMIKWEINEPLSEYKGFAFALIKLKKGDKVVSIVAADRWCDGWMPWSVPKDIEPGNDYKIEIVPIISEKENYWSIDMEEVVVGTSDESDDYFSIVAPELSDCHTSPLWDWDYCSPDCKCNVNEGDCDTDADCAEGLFCAKNVGANYGQDSRIDVCQKAQNTTY